MYKATYKKLDTGEAEFTGEITQEAFEGYRSHALEHLSKDMEVPGFRKGKAPESVLLKNIPEMAILEEMANHAIMDAYPKMLIENKVDPIGPPAVQITKIAAGNPLGFVIKTAIMPEVELPDYKKISAGARTEIKADVTDAEFEEGLKQMQRMRAQGIAENIVKENEEKGDEKKEGEEKVAEAEVLPELTDDYVKTLGLFENVEDFKIKFRENMRLEKEHRESEKNRLNIMEKILDATKITVPQILVDGELDRMLYRMKMDITGMGLSYEDYLKHLGKTVEQVREEFKYDAIKRVKMEILISEIAKNENVAPDEAEITAEVEQVMKNFPGADNARARAYVEQVLTNERVFKMLEGRE